MINQNHFYIQQVNVGKNQQREPEHEDDESAYFNRQAKRNAREEKKTEITSISSEPPVKPRRQLSKDGIVGLKNNSLYCYMNATLQCMIPIADLRDYFLDCKFQRFSNEATVSNSSDYSRKFAEFFEQVYGCDSKEELVLNPTMLKNLIRRRFTPIMQHDSHEFLMHLLSELQDEETRVGDKKFNGEVTAKNKHRTMEDIYREYFFANPSCIDQVFTGIQRSIVKCANCCYESITYKPFSCLSIGFDSTLKRSL